MNTNDVFIVCHRASVFYIWCGKRSTGDEREAAKSILMGASGSSGGGGRREEREVETVIESQERDEFWTALGGRRAYTCDKRPKLAQPLTIVRLFEVVVVSPVPSSSAASAAAVAPRASFAVAELYQFSQDDLNSYDVMLLDAWEALYVWIGASMSCSRYNHIL